MFTSTFRRVSAQIKVTRSTLWEQYPRLVGKAAGVARPTGGQPGGVSLMSTPYSNSRGLRLSRWTAPSMSSVAPHATCGLVCP